MRSRPTLIAGLLVVVAGLLIAWFVWTRGKGVSGGWGVDSCLTTHAGRFERMLYSRLLAKSDVGIIRERGVGEIAGSLANPGECRGDLRSRFRALKDQGFHVVAFAQLPFKAKPIQAGNQLPEDLVNVFEQARFMGREFDGLVDAWEMVGEADLGYCTDLPDRVAAYQKALYLGIKAGSWEHGAGSVGFGAGRPGNSALRSQPSGLAQGPLVLMGALGMPPGRWLERAAANGLLDYTDAYNFHFYGHAKDLTGVIAAHRAAIAGYMNSDGSDRKPEFSAITQVSGLKSQVSAALSLPLWITEAGIEAVDKKDFLNPARRQLQADFTISTAKQALAAKDVAVFMPFILVHDKDPYAMTVSPWHPLPAWDAYAKFTRENPWPQRPLSRPPHQVNPVVMQWLPDNRTTVPHKVSGTYRFREGQPIRGELRIYNFSEHTVEGRIDSSELKDVRLGNRGVIPLLQVISVPAMGMMAIPVEFVGATKGYFREYWSAVFVEDNGRRSPVSFGLESQADVRDFVEQPLVLNSVPDGIIKFPQVSDYQSSGQLGMWSLINGLRAEIAKPEAKQGSALQVSAARFWIEHPNTDPLAPTMAVAGVQGLPATGFLRLQLDKPMTKSRKVLVVLVDDRGQRYTIWENFGADYFGSRSDIWLNLEDFHADFWGPCSANYRFEAGRVREVQLRLYLDEPGDKVEVRLTLLRAK